MKCIATSTNCWPLLMIGVLVLSTAGLLAQSGFVLTSPVQGSQVVAGQPVTVTWTGGDPAANVNVVLIDVALFQVVGGFGVAPNTGSRVVTVASSFGCGRQFQFYIEDSPRTMWTYGGQFTLLCRVPVAIDVQPGSSPNSINLGSNGTTPVAILGSATLDVNTIDVETLTFGTAGVKTVGKTARYMCSIADVSGDFSAGLAGRPDGFPDLVCHFVTVNIVPEDGGTTAKIMGDFLAGGSFEGTDSVQIVPAN
jgi:hypothetical protein